MSQIHITPDDLSGLRDTVAIITGASSGIGLAATQVFALHGAIVYIADLHPPKSLPTRASFVKCDVTKWADLLALFAKVQQDHGRVDTVIANAGIAEVEDLFLDEFDEATGALREPKHTVVAVNLIGVMNTVKIAVHYMRKQSSIGSIILTSSAAGYMGEPGLPAYTATKHGLVGLLRSLSPNLPKFNIAMSVIAPYMTESRLMFPELRQKLQEAGVIINTAENVGLAMGYLASKKVNGKGLYCAANSWWELEDQLRLLEPQWLGERNCEQFRKASSTHFFTSKSGL